MSMFQLLSRAKSLGWNFTTLLVHVFLEENGPTPIGLIARACGLSVRSVERAMAVIKQAPAFSSSSPSKMTHDHAFHSNEDKRTATEPTVSPDKTDVTDPLAAQLLDYGVLPWCVEALLTKVDREVVTRQLAYHAYRLATGFVFKSHPARYLFRACLNDYQAPEGYVAEQVRAREGVPAFEPKAAPVPVATEAPRMTREGALVVIRMGMRSKLPVMRHEALKLAAEWGIPLEAVG